MEEENARLKRMYADLSLDHNIKGCYRKKALRPCQKRELAAEIKEENKISTARAH